MTPHYLFAAVVLAASFCLVSCGGNNHFKQNADLEAREAYLKRREDSLRLVEQKQKQEQQKQNETKEEDTFTTTLGTFYTDRVLTACYKQGATYAATYRTPGWKSEERFKEFWKRNMGVPDNDKAKEVYTQGFERFKKGFDDTIDF